MADLTPINGGSSSGGGAMDQVFFTELRHLRETVLEIRATMGSYPALIERQATADRRLLDTDERLNTIMDKLDKSFTRSHERIDEMSRQVHTDTSKLRLELNEFGSNIRNDLNTRLTEVSTELNKKVSDIRTDVNAQIATLDNDVNDIRTETASWINRGKGAWFAASMLLGVIQIILVGGLSWMFTEIRGMQDWRITADYMLKQQPPPAVPQSLPPAPR